MKATVTCLVAVAALAACGGGGGGGSSTAPTGPTGGTTLPPANFSNPVPILPGGRIPTNGTAFSTPGTAVQTVMVTNNAIGGFAGPFPGQLVASSSSAAAGTPPDAIRFTVNGQTVEVDLRNAVAIGSGANADTIFLQIPDSVLDLDFAIFGGWARSSGPGGLPAAGDTVNFGAFGNPTPVGQLPTGNATYTGKSIGLAQIGTEASITSSDVTVTVNNGFQNVTFDSANTVSDPLSNLNNPQNAGGLDFTATGTVSGSGYTATGNASAPNMSVGGAFYGNAGQETAGTFSGTIGVVPYGGAFGAK